MADNKYGRVFTEKDVRLIIATALVDNGMREREKVEAEVEEQMKALDEVAKFPEDEPLFILRGQDKYSLKTILHYYKICEEAALDQDHISEIEDAIANFGQFQAGHPDRVKDPD